MAQQTHDAWKEVRTIHREYSFFYQIGGGLLLVVIGVMIGGALFGTDKDYLQELFMQALGVIITVLVLDRLAERRDERRSERELKARLVMEARSQSNETVKRAIDELRHRGWLKGEIGLLKGANLWRANLQGADLWNANLQGAILSHANLQGAILEKVNLLDAKLLGVDLQGVNMEWANLQGTILDIANLAGAKLMWVNLINASLTGANLAGANLKPANLEGANLTGANLAGANLLGANLQGAHFQSAAFDDQTILPDGSKWTPQTDLKRFTDPQHPNFWRSSNPKSPAYRGDTKP